MNNLNFISNLYRGKNCYSDHMSSEELSKIHITSGVERIIVDLIEKNKVVFLTGNPGDGKTFIIKSIITEIEPYSPYINYDLNSVSNYDEVVNKLIDCYNNKSPAIIAVNEYPFLTMERRIKEINISIYDEIETAKKQTIVYDNKMQYQPGNIVVIDLNERNLLAQNTALISEAIERICTLLKEDGTDNKFLQYNLKCLDQKEIREQLIDFISFASLSCEHFAIRDILGALAFSLTTCTTEENEGVLYFDALFIGKNPLLNLIKLYDPIYLTNPKLDEMLWNGEITDGWINTPPQTFPNDRCFDDDREGAIDCFKSIKRRFYFENIRGKELTSLQPDEVISSTEIFNGLESKKRRIKKEIIGAINKLFLPSSNEKNELRIWTTHRYDLSNEPSVALSSKYISEANLDLLMPRTVDWLSEMEFMPDHIVLKPKDYNDPRLVLDVDFIRTLIAVNNGYPVGLLAPKYIQKSAMFLQQLSDNNDLVNDNDEEQIIVASRNQSFEKSVFIDNNKYSFDEEV